jgi:3'-phosphoadenosine 5'-phosphosulfate sulfotransferase
MIRKVPSALKSRIEKLSSWYGIVIRTLGEEPDKSDLLAKLEEVLNRVMASGRFPDEKLATHDHLQELLADFHHVSFKKALNEVARVKEFEDEEARLRAVARVDMDVVKKTLKFINEFQEKLDDYESQLQNMQAGVGEEALEVATKSFERSWNALGQTLREWEQEFST